MCWGTSFLRAENGFQETGFSPFSTDRGGGPELQGAPARQRPKRASQGATMAQTQTFNGRRRVRKFFGNIPEVAEMPNLIEVQKASYDQFLMVDEPEGRPSGRGPAGRVQVGVPDLGFFRFVDARIRQVRVRSAEVRRRRMPSARPDLCRAAEGDAAPHRVRYRRGYGRQVDQGHQGAGRLHGRHAAHDAERHLHRQRHRARHRLADAPFAGRLLRPRQGQDRIRRASCCLPRASSPIAVPGSTSSSIPRTSCMPASTAAARFRRRRC